MKKKKTNPNVTQQNAPKNGEIPNSEEKVAFRIEKPDYEHIDRIRNILLILFVPLTGAVAYLQTFFLKLDLYHTISHCIVCTIFCMMIVFLYLSGDITGRINGEKRNHPARFFLILYAGLLATLVYIFIPVTGWVFMVLFVALTMTSDSITGISAASALVAMTCYASGQNFSAFLIYFTAGIAAAALFTDMIDKQHGAIRVSLAVGFQLLVIFAVEVMLQNKRLGFEDLIIPAANALLNSLILAFFLQYNNTHAVRTEEAFYSIITDPEYELMTEIRNESPDKYKRRIHTAYLVERICSALDMDVKAAKCAAYYHEINDDQKGRYTFPEKAVSIMEQINAGSANIRMREAAIVMICESTLILIRKVMDQTPKEEAVAYDTLINRIFEKRFSVALMSHTDLTLRDLYYTREMLIQEKMYYDIIR